MLSRDVVDASVSPQAHMQAVANVDALFRIGMLRSDRAGRSDQAPVLRMLHFDSAMPFDGDVLRVKILAKQHMRPDQGTRLYTVQTVEIEKPASVRGEPTSPTATPVSVPPAGFRDKFARLVAAVKRAMDTDIHFRTAWHGTPHTLAGEEGAPLGRFRLDRVGSGEGSAAFGHGLYFAGRREVGEYYRDRIEHPGEAVPLTRDDIETLMQVPAEDGLPEALPSWTLQQYLDLPLAKYSGSSLLSVAERGG